MAMIASATTKNAVAVRDKYEHGPDGKQYKIYSGEPGELYVATPPEPVSWDLQEKWPESVAPRCSKPTTWVEMDRFAPSYLAPNYKLAYNAPKVGVEFVSYACWLRPPRVESVYALLDRRPALSEPARWLSFRYAWDQKRLKGSSINGVLAVPLFPAEFLADVGRCDVDISPVLAGAPLRWDVCHFPSSVDRPDRARSIRPGEDASKRWRSRDISALVAERRDWLRQYGLEDKLRDLLDSPHKPFLVWEFEKIVVVFHSNGRILVLPKEHKCSPCLMRFDSAAKLKLKPKHDWQIEWVNSLGKFEYCVSHQFGHQRTSIHRHTDCSQSVGLSYTWLSSLSAAERAQRKNLIRAAQDAYKLQQKKFLAEFAEAGMREYKEKQRDWYQQSAIGQCLYVFTPTSFLQSFI